jgi:hypothetical protein
MKKILLTTLFLLISIISFSGNNVDKDKFEKSIFIEINGGLKYYLLNDTGYSIENMKSNTPFNADIFLGFNAETPKGHLIAKAGLGVNPFNYTYYYQTLSINGEWYESSHDFKYSSYNHVFSIGYLYKLNDYISSGFNTGIVFITSHYENENKCKAKAINLGLNIELLLTEHLILKTEPYFNYIFDKDAIRGSSVDFTLTNMIGIKLGLKYKFKNKI